MPDMRKTIPYKNHVRTPLSWSLRLAKRCLPGTYCTSEKLACVYEVTDTVKSSIIGEFLQRGLIFKILRTWKIWIVRFPIKKHLRSYYS